MDCWKITTYDLKDGTVTEETRPMTPEEAAQPHVVKTKALAEANPGEIAMGLKTTGIPRDVEIVKLLRDM